MLILSGHLGLVLEAAGARMNIKDARVDTFSLRARFYECVKVHEWHSVSIIYDVSLSLLMFGDNTGPVWHSLTHLFPKIQCYLLSDEKWIKLNIKKGEIMC